MTCSKCKGTRWIKRWYNTMDIEPCPECVRDPFDQGYMSLKKDQCPYPFTAEEYNDWHMGRAVRKSEMDE